MKCKSKHQRWTVIPFLKDEIASLRSPSGIGGRSIVCYTFSGWQMEVQIITFKSMYTLLAITPLIEIYPKKRMWIIALTHLAQLVGSEGSSFQFLGRACAWVVGQVSGWECVGSNWLMFLSHIYVSLPLVLPPCPSCWKYIKSLKKIKEWGLSKIKLCICSSKYYSL